MVPSRRLTLATGRLEVALSGRDTGREHRASVPGCAIGVETPFGWERGLDIDVIGVVIMLGSKGLSGMFRKVGSSAGS